MFSRGSPLEGLCVGRLAGSSRVAVRLEEREDRWAVSSTD